ncbi:MAG TPA: hypothetical protein VKD24_02735 [Candidatus Angelobacter sp.]|nr:hypothetical protein [Candidatus Angelobacter sp.]
MANPHIAPSPPVLPKSAPPGKIKNLQALYAAVNAAAPIDGISSDGVTIWFPFGTTPQQVTAAQNAAAAYVDAPGTPNPPSQTLTGQ